MKEDKYTKSLAKNQVCAIFHMRDIRKNVLPKSKALYRDAMFVSIKGHKYGRRKPTETSGLFLSFLTFACILRLRNS